MLTLKVITTDINGNIETNLFYGDSVTHSNMTIKGKDLQKYSDCLYVGQKMNEEGTIEFSATHVFIYEKERCLKNKLLILPTSECFIMEMGKQ